MTNLPAPQANTVCAHCGLPTLGARFCCPGCRAAYDLIQGLGLGGYYARRLLDPAQRAPKPDVVARTDLARHIVTEQDGTNSLTLAVDGVQCGACVWLIESVLARQPDLLEHRVNMTTRRLRLAWRGAPERAGTFCAAVEQLGYRLVPFDAAQLSQAQDRTGRALLRALAVAAFGAGNVMLISLGTWVGATQNMGPATRGLMHWVSALVALPCVAYAGRPFFASAAAALRRGRSNMDVPVSIGVLLVCGISLWQTLVEGRQVYFDSALTLLFFLLVGRVLDHRARARARATAEQLLMLRAADVLVLRADGTTRQVPQDQVAPGARILVGMGERVGVDGVLLGGRALMDASLVTGENLPEMLAPGAAIFAGTLNMGEAVTIRVTAAGGTTLLAECARLMAAAEHARGRYVALADRVARFYAPAVHICALATFLAWWLVLGRPAAQALVVAAAVLIITCPCALALAVPAVQVIAAARLFRAGLLLKSPSALERLAAINRVVFDKTGTLTDPVLGLAMGADPAALALAAGLAASSRHPLCRALVRAAGAAPALENVTECAGQGLRAEVAEGEVRLGSAAFCAVAQAAETGPELWLTRPGHAATRFHFHEQVRPGAAACIGALRRAGCEIEIVSGDQAAAVASVAAQLGISKVRAQCSPVEKLRHVEALRTAGDVVLMVGDGLNDGPCLAGANVSASPASAADISQNAADVVFQGASLQPVALLVVTARRARRIMGQNLALSLGYNAVMVPLAMAGLVTPWLAAAAMSGSSLLVMVNSLRLQRSGA